MPDSSSQNLLLLRRIAYVVAIVGWCGLIFAASARPDLRVADGDLLDLLLRKCAHIFVFGVLCGLVVRALLAERVGPRRAVVAAWGGSLIYACLDEWHQTFVDGRVGHPSDVVIDMVGATAVACIALHRSRIRHAPEDHQS